MPDETHGDVNEQIEQINQNELIAEHDIQSMAGTLGHDSRSPLSSQSNASSNNVDSRLTSIEAKLSELNTGILAMGAI
ncbi:hypothetical protein I4U23_010723 [Adineta vaga]|nr:hypothetical protein I4U23_010723 [Adineta vaga]